MKTSIHPPQPALHLRIDQLALRGVAPGVRRGLQAAIEQELARVAAERGGLPQIDPRRLRGLSIQAGPKASAEEIAAQVVAQLCGGPQR